MPLPVPPAMLCVRQKPSRLSAYPASRSARHIHTVLIIDPPRLLASQHSSALLKPTGMPLS